MNGGKEGGALPNGTPHETRSTSSLPNGANSRELHGSAAEALERLKTATFQVRIYNFLDSQSVIYAVGN
jgi:hypothetical protein